MGGGGWPVYASGCPCGYHHCFHDDLCSFLLVAARNCCLLFPVILVVVTSCLSRLVMFIRVDPSSFVVMINMTNIALVPGNAGIFLVTSVASVVSGGVFLGGLGITIFHVQSSISVVCHFPLLLEVL